MMKEPIEKECPLAKGNMNAKSNRASKRAIDKTVALASLKLNDGTHGLPKNPRFIRDARFKTLCASVKDNPEFMPARPIIVDERGLILGGNMRWRACKELGMKDIPASWVQRVTGWPDEKKRRFIILDNRAWGEDDMDILANEFDFDELLKAGFEECELKGFGPDEPTDAEPQIDRAEELNEKWKIKTGDLWLIGEHRLLCGDSTRTEDVARVMGGEKADVCVSDPPYGVLDEKWDRAFTQQDLDMIFSVTVGMVACFNAAKPAVLFSMLSLVPQPERVGVWRHSHIAPKPGMIWSWQPVFYWRCGDAVAWDSLDWFQGNADRDGTHPTQKPVEFFQKIIGSVDCLSVLDPFLGSGTTMVAAQNLGRKCYGIEISAAYCSVVLQRMSDAFPGIDIRKEGTK